MNARRQEIVVTDGTTPGSLPPGQHPLVDGVPQAWMAAWGEDAFGVFADVAVGEVRQRMRWVPAGAFRMGTGENEQGRDGDEGPRHVVHLTKGFWLGDTPVTQMMWSAVMGESPSHFVGAQRPVENVSWDDAIAFMSKLDSMAEPDPIAIVDSSRHRTSAGVPGFRLPSEAEWERACRAGSEAPRYGALDDVAWYGLNRGGETHDVRGKAPNALGLYDMLGNVYEWCKDAAYRRYEPGVARDPAGPEAGPRRVLRGGSWYNQAWDVRAAYRLAIPPDSRWSYAGFRLARGHHPS